MRDVLVVDAGRGATVLRQQRTRGEDRRQVGDGRDVEEAGRLWGEHSSAPAVGALAASRTYAQVVMQIQDCIYHVGQPLAADRDQFAWLGVQRLESCTARKVVIAHESPHFFGGS